MCVCISRQIVITGYVVKVQEMGMLPLCFMHSVDLGVQLCRIPLLKRLTKMSIPMS